MDAPRAARTPERGRREARGHPVGGHDVVGCGGHPACGPAQGPAGPLAAAAAHGFTGPVSNGVTVNGAAGGPAPGGPAANGAAASGEAAGGPAGSGAAGGPVANGTTAGGAAANGPAGNGPMANGPMANGPAANGPLPNGPVAGGAVAGGAIVGGAPPPWRTPGGCTAGGRAATAPDLQWDRAVELIAAADEVCLACHIAPDGDALGSMLALGQALRALGKRCLASFGEPFRVPAILRFLPGQELLVEPDRMPADPALMISLDAAGQARLGSLAGRAERARALIVVDHHASNTGFGGVRLVDPAAAATAVLVEELIRRLGVPLDGAIAEGLYAGLASDTGSFKYPCTTPEVHSLAGRLLTAGVRPEAVSRELWDRAPFGYLQVLAGALGRARLERDAAGGRGLVWTTIARADRRGVPYDQLEGIIDQLRRTDEAEVAVVCKETDDGRWYVSVRSKGHIDLSGVCAALNGGGHREMAGFLWEGTSEEALDRLRAQLPARR